MNSSSSLSKSTKRIYALATSGYYITMTLFNIYSLVFMTNCLKISALTAASIISIAEVFVFGISVFLGSFIENANLPWGKYRSWFLISPILAGISCVLFFSPLLTLVPSYLILPLGVVLVLVWNIASGIAMISHSSLNALLTSSPSIRVELNKTLNQYRAIVGAIAGYLMFPMVEFFGKAEGLTLRGMTAVSIIFSSVYAFGFFRLFAHLKYYKLDDPLKRQRVPMTETIRLLLKNSKFAALTVSTILTATGEVIFTMLSSYFFVYVLNDSGMMGTFNWTSQVFAFIGTIFAFYMARKLSNKYVYIVSYILQAVMYYFIYRAVDMPIMALLFICLGIIGQSIAQCTIIPMFSEVADDIKKETGRDETSVVMVANNLIYKVSGLIGALGTFMLSQIGFVSGVEPNIMVIEGIRRIITILPALFIVFGIIVMIFYYRSTSSKREVS